MEFRIREGKRSLVVLCFVNRTGHCPLVFATSFLEFG